MIKTMMKKVLFGIVLFVGGMFAEACVLQMIDKDELKKLLEMED